mmetsp:Transcript_10721/g.24418  ORF Transcript_10721/g.24418 Transcript_10721/m.24418 type:complete len:309 (-) Transcript_10721:1507-2433(-)
MRAVLYCLLLLKYWAWNASAQSQCPTGYASVGNTCTRLVERTFFDETTYYSMLSRLQSSYSSPGTLRYTMVQSGSDPNVQIQILTSTTTTSNNLYFRSRIQDYYTFTLQFEMYCTSGADAAYFFVGSNDNPLFESDTKGGYIVRFQVYSSRYIRLQDSSLNDKSTSSYASWNNDGNWHPVTIKYTKHAWDNTLINWKVVVDTTTVINVNVTDAAAWVASSGNFWGFGGRTGGGTMSLYVRKMKLTFEPCPDGFVMTTNGCSIAQQNINNDCKEGAYSTTGKGLYLNSYAALAELLVARPPWGVHGLSR